jgi:hypothetical protein
MLHEPPMPPGKGYLTTDLRPGSVRKIPEEESATVLSGSLFLESVESLQHISRVGDI